MDRHVGANWNDGGSWTYTSAPNGAGAVAYFTTGGGSIALVNSTQTIGFLAFDSSQTYNISAGTNTPNLAFDNTGGNGNAQIVLSATSAAQTISVPMTLANTDLTITNNSSNALTLSGAIAGSGRSLNLAAGTLILSGTGSTYTGGTNIAAGSTLLLGASNVLADTGAVTVSGGTFNIQSYSDAIGTLTLAGGTVTGGGTLTPASVVLQQGLLSVALGGSGAVSKTTTGTVQLAGTNILPSGTALSVANGVLDLQSYNQAVATLSLTGGTLGAAPGSATLNLATSADLQAGTVNVVLGGAGSVQKSTAGTVVLNAGNTYAGNTSILAGTLQAGLANSLPAATILTISTGATFNMNSSNQVLGGLSGNGGTITSAGSASLNVNVTSGTQTSAAVITGAVAFTKSGAGTQVLSGAGTYTGGASINGGTLTLGVANAIPTNTPVLYINNATFNLNGFAQTVLTLNLSNGTVQGGGTFTVGDTTVIAAHSLFNVLTASGTNLISGGSLSVPGLSGTRDYALFNITSGTTTITSQLTGTMAFIKTGGGTLVLANPTPGNDTWVQTSFGFNRILQGTVQLGADEQFMINSGDRCDLIIGSNGTFDLHNHIQTVDQVTGYWNEGAPPLQNAYSGDGTLNLDGGTLRINNSNNHTNIAFHGAVQGSGMILYSDTAHANNSGNAQTYDGLITSTGSVVVTAGNLNISTTSTTPIGFLSYTTSGGNLNIQNSAAATQFNVYGGTMTLSGLATAASPAVTVTAGTFRTTGNNRLSSTATITLSGTGTFDLNGSNQTVGAVNGPGGIITTAGAGTLTINQTAASATLGAQLSAP